MSLTRIESVIKKFVANDDNDALVIKGKYGVGKTYYWQNLIKELSRESRQNYHGIMSGGGRERMIGKSGYAYVSLFGVDSLDALKSRILSEHGQSRNINGLSNRSDAAVKRFFAKVEKIPNIERYTGGILSVLAFNEVRNALVCFDDIDRKSPKFPITEVVGLASQLKEQHACKIVFILNEDELEEEGGEFRKQIEKLADFEILFAPDADDVLAIVFAHDFQHSDFIKKRCRELKIKNIRTLQKIRRAIENLHEYSKNAEKVVVEDLIRAIVLFVWSHYDKEGAAPPLEFVENYSWVTFYLKEERKEPLSQQDQDWKDVLTKYGYRGVDEIDGLLINFVKNGFLQEQEFREKLLIKNQEIERQNGQNSYGAAWSLFNTTFEDNEREFVEQLVAGFRANSGHLEIRQLDETVSILRSFEENEKANNLVDEYLEKRIDAAALTKVKYSALDFRAKDSYINQKLAALVQTAAEARTIGCVIKGLSSRDGYDIADIEFLAQFSADDFYNYFKSVNSGDLYFQVKACYGFADAAHEPYKTVGTKSKQAILRIASESRISRLRIVNWLKISENEIEQIKTEYIEH